MDYELMAVAAPPAHGGSVDLSLGYFSLMATNKSLTPLCSLAVMLKSHSIFYKIEGGRLVIEYTPERPANRDDRSWSVPIGDRLINFHAVLNFISRMIDKDFYFFVSPEAYAGEGHAVGKDGLDEAWENTRLEPNVQHVIAADDHEFTTALAFSTPRVVLCHDLPIVLAHHEAVRRVVDLKSLLGPTPPNDCIKKLDNYEIFFARTKGANYNATYGPRDCITRLALYEIALDVRDTYKAHRPVLFEVPAELQFQLIDRNRIPANITDTVELWDTTMIESIFGTEGQEYSPSLHQAHLEINRDVLNTTKKKRVVGHVISDILCDYGDIGVNAGKFVEKVRKGISPVVVCDTNETISLIRTRVKMLDFDKGNIKWSPDTKSFYNLRPARTMTLPHRNDAVHNPLYGAHTPMSVAAWRSTTRRALNLHH